MRVLLMLVFCCWIMACSSTPEETADHSSAVAADGGRQIVRRASLHLEVETLAPAVAQTQALLSMVGGYVQSLDYVDEKHARLVCQVPASKRESFIIQIKSLGTILDESLSAEDITNAGTDIEAELANLYKLRNRIKALLKQKHNIDDVWTIEKELNRVQARIEFLEKTQRNNQQTVAISQVSVALDEKESHGPLGLLLHGIAWTLKALF